MRLFYLLIVGSTLSGVPFSGVKRAGKRGRRRDICVAFYPYQLAATFGNDTLDNVATVTSARGAQVLSASVQVPGTLLGRPDERSER